MGGPRVARALGLAIVALALPAAAIAPRLVKGRLPATADAPGWRLDAVSGDGARAVLSAAAGGELDALGWEALADPSSGLPLRVWGPPVSARAEDARSFLAARPAWLGFQPGAEGYDLVARAPFAAGKATVVVFDETWNGFPVEGVHADLRFVAGNAVMARLHLARNLDAATKPVLSGADALARGLDAVRASGRTPSTEPAPALDAQPLVIVRHDDTWRLAWAVRLDAVSPPGRLTVWIDAVDGGTLAMRDEIRSGTGTDTPLSLKAWHEPRRAGDVEVLSPLPFIGASDGGGEFVTDTSGNTLVPVTGSRDLGLLLAGPFVKVLLWDGSSAAAVQVDEGVPAEFDWDQASAGLSERDAAISNAIVRTRMKRMAPDLAWLDSQIPMLTDIPDPDGCNAFWDGTGVQFFAESSTCNATARIADVVFHETGHGLHQHLAAGGIPPADLGEGSADYVAATINGDPEIGPSFYKDSPEGLRNLEPDLVFPDDLTNEPHGDGLIWGGAFWDLRTRLIATLGTSEGISVTDKIFADTLRFNPVMEDGFWDALLAADDDGNISNGGPYECDVVAAFGAHGLGPGDGLGVTHLPLGQQPPGAGGYRVRAHIASAFPRCGATGVQTSELEWRRAGETAWSTLSMGADLVPGWRTAMIPAQPEGTTVEYRLHAVDAEGGLATAPATWFDVYPFRFDVRAPEVVFEDDFETDKGWQHFLLAGNEILGADDWQRGTPHGRAGDPDYAFSGATVWGNDLGEDPFNGAYQANIHSRLQSPLIDCRRCRGARLQFRRWLGVDDVAYDRASVFVNGTLVWTNGQGTRLRDREWRFEDVDISGAADGRKVRVRFELETDGGIQLGGWNVDDVRITRDGEYHDAGSCSCSLAATAVAPGPWALLALAAAAILVRRRLRAGA